ncbi:hypothetical protein COV27_00205 [candidate division WWE3 bacterium CG10_big_fil_rev_8_21_14_0_10_39_14]|nr:MAG: hypothetical protein COV27_00205 [candidate division WWE3 bacterium CG10_big_fil_rev_8_21_14_0_10_39_14]
MPKEIKEKKPSRRASKEALVKVKEDSDVKETEKVNPDIRKNKFFKPAIFIFAFLIIGALLYKYKGAFVVATVNGKPISRLELIRELEKQGGKQALDSIITENLIMQTARNKNIVVAQGEIEGEIKKIEESLKGQNLTLENALSLQGLTRNDLDKQIVLQKSLEKILADKIVVTDEEAAKYVEDNKESFPKDGDLDALKEQAKEFLAGQKFSNEVQKWLLDIKTSASIKYFVNGLRIAN